MLFKRHKKDYHKGATRVCTAELCPDFKFLPGNAGIYDLEAFKEQGVVLGATAVAMTTVR